MAKITKISQLKEWEKNPRTITKKAAEALGFSIQEFGDLSGIVFNKRNSRLVCGHQRRDAIFKKFGDLPILDGYVMLPGGEKVAYREVDWDDTKHAAANIAANSPYLQGNFTSDLDVMVADLRIESVDLSAGLRLDELVVSARGPKDAAGQSTKAQDAAKYLASGVKQVVIYIKSKDFPDTLRSIEKLCTHFGVDNHSEACLKAIDMAVKEAELAATGSQATPDAS